MADEKLSQLPTGTAIVDADLSYWDQSSTSVKQPASAISTYANSKLPVGSAAQKGIVEVDGTSITASAGVISATSTASTGANPTATAGPAAINGSATTFLRSDGAPAVQKASATQFGIVEVDNTTITAAAGVITAVQPTGANPTGTAGPAAVNGTATTFMRSDGAPAVQKASASVFGIVEVDNTTITAAAGVITAALRTAANPSATAGPAAVNGSAATYMRSDAAPAVQKASNTQFGIVEVDNTTITAAAGVISTPGGANPSATASDTAVNGSATTFMRSDAAPAVQKTSATVFGLAKVDGTTITAVGGVISSTGGGGGGNIETETGTSPIKISAFSTATLPLGSTAGGSDLVTGLQGGVNVNFNQTELLSAKSGAGGSNSPGGSVTGSAGAGDGTGAGGSWNIYGGAGGASAAGGGVYLSAGAGGATGAGGRIEVYAGAGSGTANGGNAYFRSGSAAGSGYGGLLYFGSGGGYTSYGGNLNFSAGYSHYGGGGGFYAQAGNSGTTAPAGGCYFKSGTSVNQTSAHFYIYGGHGGGGFGAGTFLFAASDNAPPGNGGDIYFKPGTGAAQGRIVFANAVSTPGTSPGTLTNAPAVGNPQTWLAVTINSVDHFIPAWHV